VPRGTRFREKSPENQCNREVTELPQINLARLIIAGPSIFVKVVRILQNISYEEVNRGKKEIRLVNGAPELGRSERGAEAIAEART